MNRKYRRVAEPPGFVQDEIGLRYSISNERKEVLSFAPFFAPWRSPDKPKLWESIHRYSGSHAEALIKEIMASIEEPAQ
jgi:hypothetical protein